MNSSKDRNQVITIEKFASQQAELLALERAAELDQSEQLISGKSSKELSFKGLGLFNLIIDAQRSALFDRVAVTFKHRLTSRTVKELPAHSFTNGDILGLYRSHEPTTQLCSGVVTQVKPDSIEVAFDTETESNLEQSSECQFNLIKLANDVTYRRLKRALDSLNDSKTSSNLKNCLFGTTTFSPANQTLPDSIRNADGDLRFINEKLDESQKSAVKFALLQKELAIIHGPPGTGKTTTVVEIISNAVKAGNKILCCAPSNVAVDNLLDRLVKNNVRVVRLGHPARIHEELHNFSLDAIISRSDQTQIVRDVRQDISKTLSQMKSGKKGKAGGVTRELKELRKELRERERKAMKDILTRAEVVLATLTSASCDGPLKVLPENHFDITVIDECSQSLELACWIALPFARKTILAGDHNQLPPTIMSETAAKKGLEVTLMERILNTVLPLNLNSDIVRMLEVQYRMHSKIMEWSSNTFYKGLLKAHSSVASHLLCDINGVEKNDDTDKPLVLIDTSGCDMFELQTTDEQSKANEGEVALVCIHVESLISSGIKPVDIAVITPYNLQVEFLRLQLSERYPSLEIRSVDGFQGREKEAVVLSLVRSNTSGEVGFLAEARRLNVAVTRGRRHVAVIGDVQTVSRDPILKGFMQYLEKEGDLRSAMQYEHRIRDLNIHRPEGLDLRINDEKPSKKSQSESSSLLRKDKGAKLKKKKTAKPDWKTTETPAKSNNLEPRPYLKSKNEEMIHLEQKSDESVRTKFKSILKDFCAQNESTTYAFSPELNSHDRFLVHEIAENLDLIHESVGDGSKRHIVVKKKKNDAPREVETVDNDTIRFCDKCKSKVPRSNFELHSLRCGKNVKPASQVQASSSEVTKKSKKKVKPQIKIEDEADFDEVIESFANLNKVCNLSTCKVKVSLVGITCEHCNLRYCLSHGMPEIHGCGNEASKAAKLSYAKAKQQNFKPPDPCNRKQLQKKLEKKLDAMGSDRKPKKKEK